MSPRRFLDDIVEPRAARDASPVIDAPLLPTRAAREGLFAGVLAAAGVALWFFVTDLLSGAPLATPRHLGTVVAGALGLGTVAASATGAILFYSLLHFAAFALLGIAAVVVIILARREPGVLAGALIALAIAETVFYYLLTALRVLTPTGPLTLGQVALGNLVGLGILGLVLWRRYPELGPELHRALAKGE
jgi:ABC-type Fe3+-siderophore transport system permease subunit